MLEVASPAEARAHILLEMRPNGQNAILIAHPGDTKPVTLSFDQWSDGPLGAGFSYEDFLEPQYYWPNQTLLEETRYGARDCDVLKSVPGASDRTHYAEIRAWLDHSIGFPVHVEKTLKGTGGVKEFTYFGLRQNGGVWSATQVEQKMRGRAGSMLLIIDRGSAKANLGSSDFSAAPTAGLGWTGTTFLGRLMDLLLGILCFAAALIFAGFLYQWIGSHRDRLRYARDGRWVKTESGCELYLLEKGSGGPAVLFEAGIAATNLNWFHIQEAVSRFTCTASYDRGGLGWSNPCRTARTPSNIASELHDMLQGAGIQPPYILVGHSFGGLVMRRYAVMHPKDVAGVVLIDPMRIEEWPPLDPSKQFMVDRGKRLTRCAIPIARFGLARLAVTSLLCRSGGISRWLAGAAGDGGRHVLGRITDEVGKLPQEVWPIVAAHWSRPEYYEGMYSHVVAVPDTVREMQDA